MATETPGTIPRYRLAPPDEDDALAMLARVVGVDEATNTWLRACRKAGVRRTKDELSPGELLRVCEQLASESGRAGVIGASLAVRARTYLLLSGGVGR